MKRTTLKKFMKSVRWLVDHLWELKQVCGVNDDVVFDTKLVLAPQNLQVISVHLHLSKVPLLQGYLNN